MTLAMRWQRLLPRERLVISGALVSIVVALVATRIVPTWNGWATSETTRLHTLADSLSHMQQVTSVAGRRLDSVRQGSLESALSRVNILTARGEEEAATAVLELLTAAGDDVGVSFSSLQRVQQAVRATRGRDRRSQGLTTVGVRATGVANPADLPELLAFIDTSRVQLATKSISVSASSQASGQRAADVRFDLVVSSLVRVQGTQGKASR